MAAVVKNTIKGMINVDYKAIIEEVYFKIIIRRSAIFIKSQIASQLDTPLINKRRYITNFAKV